MNEDWVEQLIRIFPEPYNYVAMGLITLSTVLWGLIQFVGFSEIKTAILGVLRKGDKKMGIVIKLPLHKSECFPRTAITGTKMETDDEISVILHDIDAGTYVVQPRTTNISKTEWSVFPHFGTPGDTDIGKQYEIMAVSEPECELIPGQKLSYWPKAKKQSNVVRVMRA